jgi:ABC-type multidrug transport system fused ATPase/permease subunit
VIDPGSSVALVGRSGAGTSTITDLLLRFHDPTDGRITFDGVDLRELDPTWLRQQMGVVPQQTFLFAGSVAENIAYGKSSAEHAEVVAAACQAHAHEFITALPDGYRTEIGERGSRLSGGEMQRLAIARALIVDPKLLILDEATSSLDPESEQRVQQALDEVMSSRTTLLIAHKLNTAARADRVIVLSGGRILESGSHAELAAAGGTYAGMLKAFAAGVFDGSLD